MKILSRTGPSCRGSSRIRQRCGSTAFRLPMAGAGGLSRRADAEEVCRFALGFGPPKEVDLDPALRLSAATELAGYAPDLYEMLAGLDSEYVALQRIRKTQPGSSPPSLRTRSVRHSPRGRRRTPALSVPGRHSRHDHEPGRPTGPDMARHRVRTPAGGTGHTTRLPGRTGRLPHHRLAPRVEENASKGPCGAPAHPGPRHGPHLDADTRRRRAGPGRVSSPRWKGAPSAPTGK